MYESPFDMVMTPLSITYEEVKKDIDGQIIESVMKATRSVNVTVDKEELLRALRYDRNQYVKGYVDAKAEILRCKDCKHLFNKDDEGGKCWHFNGFSKAVSYDDFCSCAERRTDG